MKKIIFGILIIFTLGLMGLMVALFTVFPKVSPAPVLTVAPNPERLARGKYLAEGAFGCVSCHSPRQAGYTYPVVAGQEFSGGVDFSTLLEGIPGTLAPQNLTPHHLGSWGDGEIFRAITAGVSKDGRPLFPQMPYALYAGATREDVFSVIAYLRSLKPIARETPKTAIHGPMAVIMRLLPKDAPPAPTPAADPVSKGRYLAQTGGCVECHTPVDDKHRPLPGMEAAGGQEFRMKDGSLIRSANLTPDEATGIGRWSAEQFVKTIQERGSMVRSFKMESGSPNTLMPYEEAARLSEQDLKAIHSYLKTLKPVAHGVVRWQKT